MKKLPALCLLALSPALALAGLGLVLAGVAQRGGRRRLPA